MTTISSLEQLDQIYGKPGQPALVKEVDYITPHYRAFIKASPFCALATSGPEGLDCSPRGDRPGFVRVADARTLQLPDRRGNNRTDSLKNIIREPHVALLFLIPGCNETLRVKGRAHLSIDPELLEFVRSGREGAALGDGDRGRHRLFPVRSRASALRFVESAKAHRSQIAADGRRDIGRAQRPERRRPGIRPRLARARQSDDVVRRRPA